MIDPGKLDRRVTIQSPTHTVGAAGGGALSWSDVATVWARKLDMSSRESRSAMALRPETTLVLQIRYRSDVSANCRLYFEGRYYELTGEPIEEGRRVSLLLSAVSVEGAAQ